MEVKSEFKSFNVDQYEYEGSALGAEGRKHYVLQNKENGKYGLLYNRKYPKDGSFYGPHLMSVIGKKCGIKVPQTELGFYLINDIDQLYPSYSTSFFESSLVYVDGMDPIFDRNITFVDQSVVNSTYLRENEQVAQKRKSQNRENFHKMGFEEYVESFTYYLISRGSKPRYEYSKSEVDAIRQELVDRAMFGLKLGIKGQTSVELYDYKNARLSPYFLATGNMFLMGIRNEWVDSQMEKSDEEFKKTIDYELKPQYVVSSNYIDSTPEEVLANMFETYPKQAERAYKKVTSFTAEDLKTELDTYTFLDEPHKEMALRIFETRDREFAKVHEEYKRNRTQNLE